MKRTAVIIMSLFFFLSFIYSQNNDFFTKLAGKELATFNDGITLMKMLFQDKELTSSFYENILWAAERKLFKVTIPLTKDQINPILTRREFAYWICRIYNGRNGLVDNKNITRYTAYKTCVSLGIIAEGRGSFDSFTGIELLGSFSYLDYYIKNNEMTANKEILNIEEDEYTLLPAWRQRIYKELEEQRAMEKEIRKKKNEANKNKIKKENKEKKIDEKKIE